MIDCKKSGNEFGETLIVCPYCGTISYNKSNENDRSSFIKSREVPNLFKTHRTAKIPITIVIVISIVALALFASGIFKSSNKTEVDSGVLQNDKDNKTDLFFNGVIAVQEDKWGFMNDNGEWIVEPTLDSPEIRISKNGAIIFPKSKDEIGIIRNEKVVYWVKENGLWGVKDDKGQYLSLPKYTNMTVTDDPSNKLEKYEGTYDDMIIVQVHDGKYGFADFNGNLVIEAQYDKVEPFILEIDKAFVTINNAVGVIDRNGNYLIKPKYEHVCIMEDGTYRYKENQLYGFLDKNGEVLIQAKFKELSGFAPCGLAMAIADGTKIGYIDRSGNFAIPPKYNYAKDFDKNNVAINYDGTDTYYLLNTQGECIAAFDMIKELCEELYEVTYCGKHGVINEKGEIIVPAEFEKVSYIEDLKFVFATNIGDTKGGYFDFEGNKIIPDCYRDLKLQKNGLIKFNKGGNDFGFMDKTGKIVIDPIYNSAQDFAENGLALVEYAFDRDSMTHEYRCAFINSNGEVVIDPQNIIRAKSFNKNGHAWVYTTDNLWGLIDEMGSYVVEPQIRGLDFYKTNEDNGIYDFSVDILSNGLVGFVDENGIMIEPKFKYPSRNKYNEVQYNMEMFKFYDDGFAIVWGGEGFGITDKIGEYLISPKYNNVMPINHD